MARQIYQYGSTAYQKMQNSNIWGVCFLKNKGDFSIFSWENHDLHDYEITMELHGNLKNHKSWFSYENIEKATFFRKHTPTNVAILHLLVYCGTILIYFSSQKLDFKNLNFSPIIKTLFFLYKLKKACYSRKMVWKLFFFYKPALNTHTQQWLK